MFLVGDPYKPSFATVIGRGDNPMFATLLDADDNFKNFWMASGWNLGYPLPSSSHQDYETCLVGGSELNLHFFTTTGKGDKPRNPQFLPSKEPTRNVFEQKTSLQNMGV